MQVSASRFERVGLASSGRTTCDLSFAWGLAQIHRSTILGRIRAVSGLVRGSETVRVTINHLSWCAVPLTVLVALPCHIATNP